MSTPHFTLAQLEADIAKKSAFVEPLFSEISKSIVGQRKLLEALLIGLLCRGHVLIEGVPGLAKTRTVNALARALDLTFKRIQFTPDLLPSDLIGTPVYHPGRGEFDIRKGPIFANVVLADEINRAPAKVQSALLEAMEEGQVTLGETCELLPQPFIVLATQNPLEHEGTYPLPEAQVDRFMFKVLVTYPSRHQEAEVIDRISSENNIEISPVVSALSLSIASETVRTLHLDNKVRDYILDIIEATRDPARCGKGELQSLIEHGVSPRGGISLARAARAHAFLRHRPYVVPDDVQAVAMMVLRHRLLLSYEADAKGINSDEVLAQIFSAVPKP